MQIWQHVRTYSVLTALIVASCSAHVLAQADPSAAKPDARKPGAERDGQHDFDFEFGSWHAHIRLLLHPLTGSDTWVDLEGTSVVRRVWDGRANLGELEVESSTTRIEGLSLRVYNPVASMEHLLGQQ